VLTQKDAVVTRAHEHQSRGPRNARRSKQRRRTSRGLCRSDRPLVPDEEPPLGSHLVSPRRGFAHHGIYVGHGNVVHYRSMVRNFCRGPLEEVSLARFAQERAIWVRSHTASRFDTTEVTRRARSRLGEDHYRLLSNNCEHFCEWCVRDEHRSYQVERLLALPGRLARICGDAIARLLFEGHRTFGRPMRVLLPGENGRQSER
jgi:hypothetical protein